MPQRVTPSALVGEPARQGGPAGPPVPVWTYLSQPSLGHYERLFCLSYDWASRQCTDPGANPQPYVPFLAARVADAELFTTGGSQGLLDWGPSPIWHAGEREARNAALGAPLLLGARCCSRQHHPPITSRG